MHQRSHCDGSESEVRSMAAKGWLRGSSI